MIGAVVLAAGLSTRMGKPKMLLEWGGKTVIEQVVNVLIEAEIQEIVVVAGELKAEIEKILADRNIKVVFNSNYMNGEMTDSLKVGLISLSAAVDSVLVLLGDQPFIRKDIISSVINTFNMSDEEIVMPSINKRRGHPWIIRRKLWQQVLAIKPPETMRDFFRKNQDRIGYVVMQDQTILQDMDTPEDYQKYHPNLNNHE